MTQSILPVFAIVLPINTDERRERNGKARETIRKAAMAEFGGYSMIPLQGGWRDDNGNDHIEHGVMLRIAVNPAKYTGDNAAYRVAAFLSVAAFTMIEHGKESAVYLEPKAAEAFIFTNDSDEIRDVRGFYERDPSASFESLVNVTADYLARKHAANEPLIRLARELGILPDGG